MEQRVLVHTSAHTPTASHKVKTTDSKVTSLNPEAARCLYLYVKAFGCDTCALLIFCKVSVNIYLCISCLSKGVCQPYILNLLPSTCAPYTASMTCFRVAHFKNESKKFCCFFGGNFSWKTPTVEKTSQPSVCSIEEIPHSRVSVWRTNSISVQTVYSAMLTLRLISLWSIDSLYMLQ